MVKVSNATCTSPYTTGTWVVNDGTGALTVYKTLYDFATPTLGANYDITGVMTWFNSGGIYEILPRSIDDITEIVLGSEANITSFVFTEQTGDAVIDVLGATVDIEVQNGTILTTLSPTIEISSGAIINPASGVARDFSSSVTYTVTAQDLTEKIWTVNVTEKPLATIVSIYDIQYTTTDASPLVGAEVITTGTITAVSGTNFYIQEAETAWSGIYVYDNTQSPVLGDNVTITATVTEYNGLTELTGITSYVVNSSGNTISPITLTTAEVNDEQYESVLVSVENVECLTTPDGFGVWSVDDGSGATNIDDILYVASPVVGTFYNIIGIGYERLTDYRILPRSADDIVSLTPISEVSIYEIQYTSDISGDSPLVGTEITTTGTVTAVIGTNFYIQDAEAAWSGIYVYDNSQNPIVGDNVTLTATVSEYNGLTELTGITSFIINSSSNTVNPMTLSTLEVNNEQYESVLVSVENVECLSLPDTFGVWTIDDGSGLTNVDDIMYTLTPEIGTFYNIMGVAYERLADYRILPRSVADVSIVLTENDLLAQEISIYPNPASEFIFVNSTKPYTEIFVQNVFGQSLIVSKQNTLDISSLDNGIYFISVYDNNTLINRTKLIKK